MSERSTPRDELDPDEVVPLPLRFRRRRRATSSSAPSSLTSTSAAPALDPEATTRRLRRLDGGAGVHYGQTVGGGGGGTARRRLLDVYGDSLKHVNALLDKDFGVGTRHVPSHMPHLIDRHVLTEAQTRWPEHFEATSSHRFRHSDDMQFALTYMYWLMSARLGQCLFPCFLYLFYFPSFSQAQHLMAVMVNGMTDIVM